MTKKIKTGQSKLTFIILIFFIILGIIFFKFPFFFSQNALIALFVLLSLFAFTVAGIFLYFFHLNRQKKLKAIAIIDADEMSGVTFEKYIGELLKHKGFSIEFTPTSGDYGVDIVAKKAGEKYAIQIKRYNHPVGRAAISDAVAGMKYYNCNKAMVITNNYFTSSAKNLAKVNNCVLIDRDTLIDWIINFQKS